LAQRQSDGLGEHGRFYPLFYRSKFRFQCFETGLITFIFFCQYAFFSSNIFQLGTQLDVDIKLVLDDLGQQGNFENGVLGVFQCLRSLLPSAFLHFDLPVFHHPFTAFHLFMGDVSLRAEQFYQQIVAALPLLVKFDLGR
jgi:hypothetical protein